MLRRQHVLEAVGSGGQEGLSLFGNRRRVVVQDDSDGAVGRIVIVEVLEQSDEFPAAMPSLNACDDMPLVPIQRREN